MLRVALVVLLTFTPLPSKPPQLVDAPKISRLADSVGVPASVGLSIAWEESRDGRRENRYRGPGKDGQCHEIGRFQINPCFDPTRIHASCTVAAISASYQRNVTCGLLKVRQLYQRYGNWPEAIEHYNGGGPQAQAYRQRVLVNVALFTLDRMKRP